MIKVDISVVMGAYNCQNTIARTIESILAQSDVAFEFIIVNDGSTDNTKKVIEHYLKKDSRITLVNQKNQGLTIALINGCKRANGTFIARQDAGDVSISGRLFKQFNTMRHDPTISLISTATRFVTPNNEELYTVSQTTEKALAGLNGLTIDTLKGPSHHGSTMFRRDHYQQVGGYRKQFIVAQDLDLWTRLVEIGSVRSLEEVYYYATVERRSISTTKRKLQMRATGYILQCAQARTNGATDQNVLNKMNLASDSRLAPIVSEKKSDAAYYYFLGSNLLFNNPSASLKYLKKSMILSPLNWKIYVKISYAFGLLIRSRLKLVFER